MSYTFEKVYTKGVNKDNEDAYLADMDQGIFAVMDGATGLGGLSGKIAANTVQETIQSIRSGQSLWECVAEANARLGRMVSAEASVTSVEAIEKHNRSTCGIAAIAINPTHMAYVHAGDCMIFIRYSNEEVRCVTYDSVSVVDAVPIHLVHDSMKQKLEGVDYAAWDGEQIRQFLADRITDVKPILIHNRHKLNTPDGYSIIDGSDNAMQHLDYGTITLHNATHILLLSDGLQLPSEKSTGQTGWMETAEFAFKHGLMRLEQEVAEMEHNDPLCFKYPRLKAADDKTGILISLV